MDRWLLLTFQLPSRPSHVRVKTWRRLKQIGALSSRNSVYVLPNTDQCREDFEWVRAEIVARGGEAVVFAARSLGADHADADFVAAFNASRATAYAALRKDLDRVLTRVKRQRAMSPATRQALRRKARVWRERLDQIMRIDFFGATGRDKACQALAGIDAALLESIPKRHSDDKGASLDRTQFQTRRWITRPRPGVDRMGSAWLIRRHVDPHATFDFEDAPAESAIAFDMYGGTFTHEGSRCTFETLAHRFGIADPVVTRIGRIVHDLDMNDDKYVPPEAPTIGHVIEGLRKMYAEDHALLEQGILLFEALARSFGATPIGVARRARPKPT